MDNDTNVINKLGKDMLEFSDEIKEPSLGYFLEELIDKIENKDIDLKNFLMQYFNS